MFCNLINRPQKRSLFSFLGKYNISKYIVLHYVNFACLGINYYRFPKEKKDHAFPVECYMNRIMIISAVNHENDKNEFIIDLVSLWSIWVFSNIQSIIIAIRKSNLFRHSQNHQQ